METADVVIIGSGIVGSSVAYHLAQAGCTNVSRARARGASGQRLNRQKHGRRTRAVLNSVNIQMSKYSIDFFSKFDEVSVIRQIIARARLLFCATNEKHLAYLKANRERQNALGVTMWSGSHLKTSRRSCRTPVWMTFSAARFVPRMACRSAPRDDGIHAECAREGWRCGWIRP